MSAPPRRVVARRQSRAVAPVSGEGDLQPAERPLRRGRLAWSAGWLSAALRGRLAEGGDLRPPSGDPPLVRLLYILAVYLAAPIVCAVMLCRGFRDRSYWHNFRERFGFGARLETEAIWVHAVSVGEVQAAAPLVSTLHERHPA